ncbi:MAG: mannose-1-phosphate guanylyltransferase/mannose-6-phosphate isomerase [Desulfovibrionaceae bacterium]|nr:mannose-1-phosphate guanylyltransferase/mannose-6-phosphate isomerase [Desulfovibrionaceae bacterium]
MPSVTPVILCGGSGTRLWPLSRVHAPKQFVDLGNGRTLFGDTLARACAVSENSTPVIVTNESHRFSVASHVAQAACNATIILEPCPKNTAPAISLAALALEHENDCMLVLPSDHEIGSLAALSEGVAKGISLAQKGYIVTFGIVPTKAETGYGYIEAGEKLDAGAYSVSRFVEKPSAEEAKALLASGRYSWNSGMFLFSAQVFLQELQHFAPSIADLVLKAWSKRSQDGMFVRPNKDVFETVESLSIDYAVMEKTEKACVLPLNTEWSDLGSWEAFYQNGTADADGNVCVGDILTSGAHNNYLRSTQRLVAAVGVDNLAVVETADAILVASRDHVQSVRAIVDQLKKLKRRECEEHRLVHRPWGTYETLALDARFQVKRIIVSPGAELSLQMHHHRAEHWVVVSGTAKVTNGDTTTLLTENESTYIPIGKKHRLKNPGIIPLVMIEIQSGSYLGEDDIVRFSDVYGRTEK